MPRRRRLLATAARALALAVLLFAGSTALGQSHQSGAASAPAPRPEPERAEVVAIPISSIAGQASAVDGLLRGIEANLPPPPNEVEISERIREVEEDVRGRSDRLERKLGSSYDRGDLDEMQAAWRSTRSDLSRWEALLEARLAGLEARRDELQERARVWDKTAEEARDEKAPASVRNEIANVQSKLAASQRALRKSRNAALSLQRSVVALESRVDAQLDAIASAREQVLRRVFRQNDRPLWEVARGDFQTSRESLQLAIDDGLAALRRYAVKNGGRMGFHLFLILALMGACFRARRAVLAGSADAEPRLPPALERPLSAGLLLGLTQTVWLHADAPPRFGQMLTLTTLPFWYLVLRTVVPQSLRRPLIGLLVLVPIELLRQLLLDFELLSRLLQAFEAAYVFAGVVWLRRPSRLGAVPQGGSRLWVRVLAIWTRAALIGSSVAFVGSVAGFTTISDLVLTTIASGTFIGSVLFAATRVLEGMAEGLVLTGQLRRIRVLHNHPRSFLRNVARTGRALAFAAWLYRILVLLSVRNVLADSLGSLLEQPLGYGNVQITLGGLAAFGVTLWLSWLLSRLLASILEEEVFTRVALPRGVPFALSTIGRYVILVLGFVLAIAALGVEVGNLALLVSALGVGIGFGMQNIVNNFISGLILLFERPIKVGDSISIDPILGQVTRIGIRASTIRSFDGADVIVPNGDLISNRVVNWTLADTHRRIHLPVGVVYGTSAPKVIELLEGVAKANPEVLENPPPMALFGGFGDSSLDFELRAWTDSPDALTLVRSSLAVAVQQALADADIEVPFPQRDLHLKTLPDPPRNPTEP